MWVGGDRVQLYFNTFLYNNILIVLILMKV